MSEKFSGIFRLLKTYRPKNFGGREQHLKQPIKHEACDPLMAILLPTHSSFPIKPY